MNWFLSGLVCGSALRGCRSRSLSGRRIVSLSRNPSASEETLSPSFSRESPRLTSLDDDEIRALLTITGQLLEDHDKRHPAREPLFSDAVNSNIQLCNSILEKSGQGAGTSDGQGLTPLISAPRTSKDMVQLFAEVLKCIGNRHWMVAGLSLLAFCIDRYNRSQSNREECWTILKKLKELAEAMFVLYDDLPEEQLKELFAQLSEYVQECLQHLQTGNMFSRWICAPFIGDRVRQLDKKTNDIMHRLNLSTVIQIVKRHRLEHRPCASFNDHSDAVGLADRVTEITSLLEYESVDVRAAEVRAVIIWGMPGVGTSTLGEAACATLQREERFGPRTTCRVNMEHVQVIEEKEVLKEQTKIFKTFNHNEVDINDCMQGRRKLSKCFKDLDCPVLLFIDNVEHHEQIAKLLPEKLENDLQPGSRLVVSTSDQKVFETVKRKVIKSCRQFEAKLLEPDLARELFCVKAFGAAAVPIGLKTEVDQVLQICEGNPLALEVAGTYVESVANKKKALKHVFTTLSDGDPLSTADRLTATLKFAYDQLVGSSLQSTFLDISANFVGRSWQEVRLIFGARLTTLKELSLVKKERPLCAGNSQAVVAMHSLFVALGKRQDHVDHDGVRVVAKDKGPSDVPVDVEDFKKVELLHLERCVLPFALHEKLDGCRKLRHLDLREIRIEESGSWFPSALESFRFNCPNSRLPFPLKGMGKLILLNVSSNPVADTDLGVTFQPSSKLKMMTMTDSATLEEIRVKQGCGDAAPQLEHVIIGNCSKLQKIGPLGPSIKTLSISDCPNIQGLEEVTIPQGCRNAAPQLEHVTIRNCPNLRKIGPLGRSIKVLSISGCPNIHDFRNLEELVGLEELELIECGLKTERFTLPPNLVTLDLSSNPDLEGLPYFERSKLRRIAFRECRKLPYESVRAFAPLMSPSDLIGYIGNHGRLMAPGDVNHWHLRRLGWFPFRKSTSDSHAEENTQHKESLRKLRSLF